MNTILMPPGANRHALKGQSVVEVALLTPILILLLAGAVDLGNGFQTWITLTNAAREGARLGASDGNASVICQRVQDELANNNLTINCSNVIVSYPKLNAGPDSCPGTRKSRCPIRVTVNYPLPTLLGSVIGFSTINISIHNDMIVF